YNDFSCEQLTELLTRYGPIAEVWFDGANGEGPNGRRQAYDWPRVFGLVRRLQPRAVMFSDAGPDVRWCGNEGGAAGDPNWSTMDPTAVPYPGASGDGVIAALQSGDPHGSVWRPAETDTSIRPGWFHHPGEDQRVKSLDQLVDIWFTSVGRNSKLLLNVPPTRDGLLHATDVARLAQVRARLAGLFAEDFAAGRPVEWRVTGAHSAAAELDLGRRVTVGLSRLEEDVARGQGVARYTQAIRQDAVQRSQAVTTGKVHEQLVPYLPEFGFNPKDARFLGSPVDLLVFDGLDAGELRRVVFIEIKTGGSALTGRERQL